MTPANRVKVEQRIDNPLGERARAYGRQRLVENREQRAGARRIARSDEFEMAAADLVDQHILGGAVQFGWAQMREVAAEIFLDIAKRRTCGVRKCAIEDTGCVAEARCQRLARSGRIECFAVELG